MVVVNATTSTTTSQRRRSLPAAGAEAGSHRKAMGTSRFVDPHPDTAEARSSSSTPRAALRDGPAAGAADVVRAGKAGGSARPNIMGWQDDGWTRRPPAVRVVWATATSRTSRPPRRGGHHRDRRRPPITKGVTDFELFDEYYEFEFADHDVQILAQRHRADGRHPGAVRREGRRGRWSPGARPRHRSWGERRSAPWSGRPAVGLRT